MTKLETEFVELMREWLVSLPHDIKVAFEAMDDENLAREDRELAAAALLHITAKADPVKSRRDPVAFFADDTVLLHLVLHQIANRDTGDTENFTQRFPEFFEGLDEALAVCKDHLASELFAASAAKVRSLPEAMKGKKVGQYLDDDAARETLYEKMLEFRTNYPLDESIIEDKLKRSATVIDAVRAGVAIYA